MFYNLFLSVYPATKSNFQSLPGLLLLKCKPLSMQRSANQRKTWRKLINFPWLPSSRNLTCFLQPFLSVSEHLISILVCGTQLESAERLTFKVWFAVAVTFQCNTRRWLKTEEKGQRLSIRWIIKQMDQVTARDAGKEGRIPSPCLGDERLHLLCNHLHINDWSRCSFHHRRSKKKTDFWSNGGLPPPEVDKHNSRCNIWKAT